MTKVIFLDIDGVLNYDEWYFSDRNPGNIRESDGDIDPECANRIIRLCDLTNSKVVISSDWRIDWNGTKKTFNPFWINRKLCD